MSRLIAKAESWERVYSAFQNINFAAFDFNTVKQSILDYVKLYFPETFNDFIESSEFIAIVEVFAYIAELLAYRIDVNAHENFISTAQRKDSILRLAKFISYTTSRPLPARGLVKLSAVSTTESIVDANGVDLANRTIRWNDASNSNWKDQFVLVMNRVLDQEFGTVGPTDRFQIQDVLFELYAINMVPSATGVFSYSAKVNGRSVPMELVPSAYDVDNGIIERRPSNNSNFTLLYGQDGLGDASDTTGFFCYTKQGTLQRFRTVFDGVTPNQTYDVAANNINDTDVWINNVDPTSGSTLNVESLLPYRSEATSGISGEWVPVDLAHAQNVIFNTNPKRNKYELETMVNNQLRIIFGDGEFADIPSGTFDIWVRTSLDQDIVVPQSSVINTSSSFSYTDSFGRTQTFTFQYSLIGSLQNASASEDIEHVRATAPAVYYSQDRMVNGEDYNVFMLQDPSIMRLRAVNRTFAGDSKYITWHDASGTYENVKMFGDDGILYYQDVLDGVNTPVVDVSTLVTTYIEPLLSSTDMYMQLISANVPPAEYRRMFTTSEKSRLVEALTPPPTPARVDMYYNVVNYQWYAVKESDDVVSALSSDILGDDLGYPNAFIASPLISIKQTSIFETKYTVHRLARRLMFSSPTTAFWNTNDAARVVEYDTLSSDMDEISILHANVNCNRTGVLQKNWRFHVLGVSTIDSGIEIGLQDTNRISVISVDEANTGIPPGLNVDDATHFSGVADIIKPKFTHSIADVSDTIPEGGYTITLPIYYWAEPSTITDNIDVVVYDEDGNNIPRGNTTWDVASSSNSIVVSNKIVLYSKGLNASGALNKKLTISVNEYVYQTRASSADSWIDVSPTADNVYSHAQDALAGTGMWRRFVGRSGLNFSWFHRSPRYHLVDPAPSNIIDMFIIPKGYYISLKRWLEDSTAVKPDLPTPLALRTAYGYLLDNKMISDTVILHPGKIKLLFGANAQRSLQASFKIVKSPQSVLTDNQIKTALITAVRNFFDITTWEFGETFYYTELSTAIHNALATDISSVVLVPVNDQNGFGSLFQVQAAEDEIFYADITPDQIEMVTSYNALNMQMGQTRTVVKYVTAPTTTSVANTSMNDAYCDVTYCDRTYILTNSLVE